MRLGTRPGGAAAIVVDAPVTVPVAAISAGIAKISGGVSLATSTSMLWDEPSRKNQANFALSTVAVVPGAGFGKLGKFAGVEKSIIELGGNIVNAPATYVAPILQAQSPGTGSTAPPATYVAPIHPHNANTDAGSPKPRK